MSFGNDTNTVRNNIVQWGGVCIILEAFQKLSFRQIHNINVQKDLVRGSSLSYSTVTGRDGTGTDTDGIVNCTGGIGIGTDSTDGTCTVLTILRRVL